MRAETHTKCSECMCLRMFMLACDVLDVTACVEALSTGLVCWSCWERTATPCKTQQELFNSPVTFKCTWWFELSYWYLYYYITQRSDKQQLISSKGKIWNLCNPEIWATEKNAWFYSWLSTLSGSFMWSCLQHHMTGALADRFPMQIRMFMLLYHMFPLPVHKPAWWAGPFSLTLFTNMVSIGSIRPFWYPGQRRGNAKIKDCTWRIVKSEYCTNPCQFLRNKALGCSWQDLFDYLCTCVYDLCLINVCLEKILIIIMNSAFKVCYCSHECPL